MWSPEKAILIHAPTGMGKTHFVLNEMLSHVRVMGGRMLLASNRVAISVQQKLEVMELLGDPRQQLLTDEGIRREEVFVFLRIMTLQRLLPFLCREEGREWCEGVTVLVVDEQLRGIDIVERGTEDERDRLLCDLWYDRHEQCKPIVRIPREGKLRLNDVTAHRVRRMAKQLNQLQGLVDEHGDEAFLRLVHQWLPEAKPYDEARWLGHDKREELRARLFEQIELLCGATITNEEEQKVLRNSIISVYEGCGNTLSHHDRKLKYRALNGLLNKLAIGFRISDKKGIWTVYKTEEAVCETENHNP